MTNSFASRGQRWKRNQFYIINSIFPKTFLQSAILESVPYIPILKICPCFNPHMLHINLCPYRLEIVLSKDHHLSVFPGQIYVRTSASGTSKCFMGQSYFLNLTAGLQAHGLPSFIVSLRYNFVTIYYMLILIMGSVAG